MSFNFKGMIDNLGNFVSKVNTYLQKLSEGGGSVDLGTMFNMQFRMQIMSQYIEAVSNTMTAVHSEMMNMAKATKGQ